MSDDILITSLTEAVEARPDDLTLRLHLGGLLVEAGRAVEAVAQAGLVLARDPGNAGAQTLMQRALAATAPAPQKDKPVEGPEDVLAAYEEELSPVLPPRFAPSEEGGGPLPADGPPEPARGGGDRKFDVERSTVRLADVGGMKAVKERLELAFLGPMRNPELRKLYGKSLRGGLMLYGPPGCGKTFIARAVAGEMGARFMSLSIVDVLDMWMGNSERNLHELFQTARRNAPCVLFLDEIDALGQKRSQMSSSSMRTVANQLLAELDGVDTDNEGVFVLAATNTPWQVDPALRRPGRLDRMVLVLPPDAEARQAILELNLRDRPIAGIDLPKLVAATEDFSGADLTHLCESAAEYAMADSMRTGTIRMIEQRDFVRALNELRPSTGPWFATARNVAMFANEGGAYDDLTAYLKKRKLLR
ncbi:ATPase AAA [Actinoplanes sp. NBRC 14428]|uniref:ATPase family protein associated with various cellular activities (AAA) n=1 Tax=Pseudosporangium ferrugineum TaxID=439699 RepID=A0A2T0SEL9_9ACTN|nr:ATP-binding protein [Pseudosporangium ferrugineum]PRY31857.1 ATPase family protein associated with various cellular activities (AAA) [Pseudosporangium ferrugineum]BCJ49911.1 ATPase AAA [Actinoplanes sp. NBRC 14428]